MGNRVGIEIQKEQISSRRHTRSPRLQRQGVFADNKARDEGGFRHAPTFGQDTDR